MTKKIFLLFILFLLSFSYLNCSGKSKNFPEQNLSLFVITEDLEVGENRVALTVIDLEGQSISKNLSFFYKKINNETKFAIKDLAISDWPSKRHVFIAKVNFEESGFWEIIVESNKGNGIATVDIKNKSKTLSVGDKISSIKTPSINDFDISEISTDIKPDPNLYKFDLKTALLKKQPIIISFSTPGLCVTGTCSPQLDQIKKISNTHSGEVIVIHVEVWKNFKEIMKEGNLSVGILNDSVKMLNIETEPWTFLIDKNGIVRNRYQGFVHFSELEKNLVELSNH